jgi:hypothetical protein
MHRLSLLLACGCLVLTAIRPLLAEPTDDLDGPLPGSTNSAPVSPSDLKAAIQEKQAEIDALKKQLEDAQHQIKNLNTQNKTLQNSDQALKTEIQAAPPAAPPRNPPAPLQATPDATAPINSLDLFWYFHNNADVANQYLRGKQVAVNGKIVGFEAPIMRSIFGIELETGDTTLRVVCKFGIPRAYATIYFKREKGAIMGRTATGNEDVLLNMNDVVTIEGKCEGLDGGDVALGSCRLVE